jgi:pyruvate/2-oxoglutarate dehydrogenase complex dihydrolipoamide acyltransferase (E2) component
MSSATHPSPPPSEQDDAIETLSLGERWLPDAFRVIPAPGGFALRMVDMTQATAALKLLRDAGLRATFTHLIVRAAAVALGRNPELRQMVCGYRRLTPADVDIGLSMAGETTYAPVVVLPGADRTPLGPLVGSLNEAVRIAHEKEKRDLKNIGRIGWIIPLGFLRRLVLRWLQNTFWFRRRLAGTFQVSCLSSVDVAAPFLFYTGSLLSAGRVCDRVVVVDGQPAVRPTVWLTVCVDHVAMDGMRAGQLLKAIKIVLEGQDLVREAQDALSARRAPIAPAADRMAGDCPAPNPMLAPDGHVSHGEKVAAMRTDDGA